MSVMTIRDFNANVSRAVAMVEAGEIIDITKNGKVVAELRPKTPRRADDPDWQAAFARLAGDLDAGVPFGRAFSHDERNG